MKWQWILVPLFCTALLLFVFWIFMNQPTNTTAKVRYAVIGDSYSNGEGAYTEQAWPTLLTQHLKKEGIDIALVSNPSVTGWTSKQAIANALPAFEAAKPTFATLLIGVNDYVQGVDAKTFEKNLTTLLDRMQAALPDKKNLVLVTIPDYSVTPIGAQYSRGVDDSAGIVAFNDIITAQGKKRGIAVVDIFDLSKEMKHNPSLVSHDGLHPSAREYGKWEEKIFPVVFSLLQK